MPREPEQVLIDHFHRCHEGPCCSHHPRPEQTYRSFARERAAHVVGVLRRAGFDDALSLPREEVITRSREQVRAAVRAQLRWRRQAQDAEDELHNLRDQVRHLAEEWRELSPTFPYARLAAADLDSLLHDRAVTT